MRNVGNEQKMRKELALAVESLFKAIKPPPLTSIAVSSAIEDKIASLAAFTVKARSGVVRQGHSREILYIPQAEAPPRLARQFLLLAKSLAGLRESTLVEDEDMKTVLRVALDCLPEDRLKAVRLLSTTPTLSTRRIAEKLAMPNSTIHKVLEELGCHQVVESKHSDKERTWRLSRWTRIRLKGFLSEVSGGSRR